MDFIRSLSPCPCPSLLCRFSETVWIASIRREVNDTTATRIETGTPGGDALGFSEDLFSGWLEMEGGNRLILHYIISRHRNEGNTQALIRRWLDEGYDVNVVMPRPVMQHILRKFGFVPSKRYFPDQYEDLVEVWYRPCLQGPACVHEMRVVYAGMG
ncbi:hypothetical protein [Methanoregula sp.]|jgi:hypothetical protein|uniref:hypothetical protein n=1 Tax=Methanoregula sp. TaxID=2052170 RepID=UPI003C21DE1D